MAEKKDNVAVKFKDNVFCMIYRDKKNLLELYNALNNSNYEDVAALEVTTLNGGSYMKYKNDASFLLSMNLYMFEQQSRIAASPLIFITRTLSSICGLFT